MKTFNDLYAAFSKAYDGSHPMLYFKDEVIVKEVFEQKVERFIKHLVKLGMGRGSGVGYSLPNSTDVIPLFTAIARIGAYTVPLFYGMPDKGKIDLFQKTKANLVITDAKAIEHLFTASRAAGATYQMATIDDYDGSLPNFSESIEVNIEEKCLEETPEDLPLMMASSSGTTGIPKLVVLTQGNVGAEVKIGKQLNTYALEEAYQDRKKERNEICAVAFPLSTSVMVVLYGLLIDGTALAFTEDTLPLHFLEVIHKWKCEAVSAPPAYYEVLLGVADLFDEVLSSVWRMSAGMDFCPPALLKRLKKLFPNLNYFTNGYGLVETCNVYMISTTDISGEEFSAPNRLTLATAAHNEIEIRDDEGCSVAVGEEGELFVKGENVIKGYENNEEANAVSFKNGWFKTGDIARKESDTEITLLGRRKYFIKRGGKSISPIVVQNYMNKVEGVQESGVVGVPHPLYGEMVWAFVVKKPHCDVTLKAIKKYCREFLPFYMLPDQIRFVEAIPRNPGVGKVGFEKLIAMAKEEIQKIEGGNDNE